MLSRRVGAVWHHPFKLKYEINFSYWKVVTDVSCVCLM